GDQHDPIVGGEFADLGSPVGREVVLDPVDRHPPRIAEADLAHEAEHVTTAPTGPQPEPEAVGGDVVGAEAVAHPRPAVEGGAVALGPAPASPARPVGG